MYNEHTMSAGSNESLIPLKSYKKLAAGKGRMEMSAFLVEGKRAVNHILQGFPDRVVEVLITEGSRPPCGNFRIRFLTDKQLQSISELETHQGMMAVVRLPVETYSGQLPRNPGRKILLLEDVQDPGNSGTLIRTAAAFNFDGIIMSPGCADPFSPKCVQATAGCVLSLWIRRSGSYFEIAQELRRAGFSLVAADMTGAADTAVLRNCSKLVLALGNEARGLSRSVLEISDIRLQIPIHRGKAESLNVASCGAICMYLSSNAEA